MVMFRCGVHDRLSRSPFARLCVYVCEGVWLEGEEKGGVEG